MERFKIAINKEFKHLTGLIETLPMQYDNIGGVIHSSRNEIKLYNRNGEVLVIKYFRRLSPLNKFFFTLFGVTKAKNAYENAFHLLEHGINTPKPVGYVDCYKNFFINRSYFVCTYTDYTPIKELFSQPVEKSAEGIRLFARWAYHLHSEGIFPGDFNDSNILIKHTPGGIDFQMIDINRMKFGRYTVRKGLKNMQRLQTPPEKMGIVASEYSQLAGKDVLDTLYRMVSFRHLFLKNRGKKKRLKKALKG
jgi:hypothetical protein